MSPVSFEGMAPMRGMAGEQTLLRVFIGENDRWEHRPLYQALVELFRSEGLAGACVFKGVEGFGSRSLVHTAHLLRLSGDLPVIVEVVDSEEKIQAVLPMLDPMLEGGLVTLERVRVIRYGAKEA